MRSLGSRVVFAAMASICWLVPVAQPQDLQQRIGGLEQQAQKHLQEQKPQLAIPVLREIVSADPQNLNARANLGVLLFFQGNYTDAIPHMRAAIQLKPDLSKIQALLGIAEKRTGDIVQAQNDLEGAFSILDDPKVRIDAGLELIEIYSAASEIEKALGIAVKLQALAPENPRIQFVSYHLSRRTMDQSVLNMLMLAPDSAEMRVIMACELARQGDVANAIAQYREAIRLNPALPGAHFELAELLRLSTDPASNAQAEEAYKKALQVNPYDAKAWSRLGGSIAASGDFKDAAEHYRRALALQPKDADAKTGLAIVLISLNQKDEAISLLESALKDDPTNTTAHYRLSMLYRSAGRTADAEREMAAFREYQNMREKLDKIFKRLGGAVRENTAGPGF